jgi:uncharacterized protein (TIGR04255 family)
MSEPELKLKNTPIVEAVLDIDCDMPPSFDVSALEETARDAFRESYPKFRTQVMQEHTIEAKANEEPRISVRHRAQGFQFLTEDERQLVQIRPVGFTFNRLAPYDGLDQYLPEIERVWDIFRALAKPVAVRRINLRFINRILLPMDGKQSIELNDYLQLGPRLVDESNMSLASFLHQHSAIEKSSGNILNVVLTAQPPFDEGYPIIFDITATALNEAGVEPEDWGALRTKIQALRILKNRVFQNTLTDKCLKLYR